MSKPGLIDSRLGWGTIALPGDEPSFIVVASELDERGSQFVDGIEPLADPAALLKPFLPERTGMWPLAKRVGQVKNQGPEFAE